MSIIECEPQVLQPQPAELDETSQILVHAAQIIRRDGWWQSGAAPRNGTATCMMLALAHASFLLAPRRAAQRRLYKSFGLEPNNTPGNYNTMTAWNDAPGRTKEDVVNALERAAYIG